MGTLPKCEFCQYHHAGRCSVRKCESCGKIGHLKDTCRVGTGRGGQRGFGNNNRGGNGNGNRNGGNGNRGNFGNQAGNGNRNQNNNQGGNGDGNGRGPRCFNCGDIWHFKLECPELNQARGKHARTRMSLLWMPHTRSQGPPPLPLALRSSFSSSTSEVRASSSTSFSQSTPVFDLTPKSSPHNSPHPPAHLVHHP
ncbi:ATP-dependent RNA helicase glh-2-like [Helianthus annuus]|uniref:ATP-dependent RNA helicase glh-2-like n=1 Tax=Helianthus annuus TaxID=4232 RepID=UPI001652C539|nr:ATP-dependent RNA helicase glh-2-like [Helianthus annuus]